MPIKRAYWTAWLMAAAGLGILLFANWRLMDFAPSQSTDFKRITLAPQGGIALGFEGEELKRWKAPKGFELTTVTSHPERALLLAQNDLDVSKPSEDWTEQGVHWRLPKEFAHVFAGQRLRITLEARAAEPLGDIAMGVLFDSRQFGNSGWKIFNLSEHFQKFSFEYQVKHKVTYEELSPVLILRPTNAGADCAIELRMASVILVPTNV